MRLSLFLIPLLLSSACSDAATYEGAVGAEQSASASAEARASGAQGEARSVAEVTDVYEFKYSYPAAAGAYPVLKQHLDANLDRSRAGLIKDATEAKKDAEENGYPYRAYAQSTEWKVVTDLPAWLSLSEVGWNYTGGAHGMYGTAGLLFDKNAKVIREPLDLFRSPAALQSAVEGRWCSALDIEREERRGEPVDKSDELFGGCPGIDQLTVLLGSSNGKSFDRIGLIAGPYVAGSYAEGAYEVTLPVDDVVLAAVKPEFVGAFSVKR